MAQTEENRRLDVKEFLDMAISYIQQADRSCVTPEAHHLGSALKLITIVREAETSDMRTT